MSSQGSESTYCVASFVRWAVAKWADTCFTDSASGLQDTAGRLGCRRHGHSSFVVSFAKSETAPQGRPTYQKDNARQRLVLPFAAGFALAVAFFGADFFAIGCSFDLDRERSARAATSNQPYHDCKANADILYGAEPVREASAG